MNRRFVLATALLAPLAGCATFGTNVKGSFSCQAPDGICAPSSVIDDRALALIAGESGSATSPAPAAAPALLRSRSVSSGQVAQPMGKVLRIVFPAHVDRQGRFHEQSVVRAIVDQGTWLAAADPPAPVPAVSESAAVATTPVPPSSAVTAITAPRAGPPSADTVRAARARAAEPPRLSRETIAAEVEAVLARPVAGEPAGFPAKVED